MFHLDEPNSSMDMTNEMWNTTAALQQKNIANYYIAEECYCEQAELSRGLNATRNNTVGYGSS